MATGQPVITGQNPGGNVPDVTMAQEDQGASPTIVMPFSDVTVRDGTDLVQATVEFFGNGGAYTEPNGLIGITGASSGSIWKTGYISPAALTAILRGVTAEMGAIGSGRDLEGFGPTERVPLTITDQITGATAAASVEYDQVPIVPLVVSDSSPSQSVTYGGSVHPFSGVTVTDPNATAAYQPNFAASFSISGGQVQGGTLSGAGVVAISQQSGNYVIDAPNLATFSNDLQSLIFTASPQSTALPGPVTISWGISDGLGQSPQQTTTITEPPPPPWGNDVTQFYQDILQRSPDPGGLAYWTGEITSGGMSAATLEQSIINAPETQNNVVPIVEMYAILGRAPDQAGLNGWVHALEGGASLPGIALAFISSPEGQGIYGAVPTVGSSVAVDTAFTTDLYKNILGRAPDAGGLGYWVNQLQSGLPAQNEVLGFIQSPEAQARFGGGSNAVNSWLVAAGNGTFNSHFSFGSS